MTLSRRKFLAGSFLFLLEKKLFAESNNFSDLNDNGKMDVLFGIVKEMDGKYTFPVLFDDSKKAKQAKKDALGVNNTSFEFGSGRPYRQIHKGIDVYGFGKDIVYFADGEVEIVGRNVAGFDHGNLVVVNHGDVNGYDISSYYLHIGGINGIKKGDRARMGNIFAKVDCTGISYERYDPKKEKKLKIPYTSRSRGCKNIAHLHFQIKVGDMYVNPNYFFPDYSRDSLPKLRRWRLAIKAGSIEDFVKELKRGEKHGSF